MHKLSIAGIRIPDVYVCENKREAEDAKHYGLPYIMRPKGYDDEKLIAYVMFRTLRSKFPHINWFKVFKINPENTIIIHVPGDEEAEAHAELGTGDSNIADIAEDERVFHGGFEEGELDYCERKLDEYIGDMSSEVNIEQLQALNLLPTFLSDIADSIKRNLYGYDWTEGYNKKRGIPLGNFNAERVRKNLIILDISGSIPRGISATMLTLIDTLRTQANADLIITGSTSLFYANGDSLPDPRWIRCNCGYGNEAKQFYKILHEHVMGNEYGNVICFGDNDCPEYFKQYESRPIALDKEMSQTKVGKVWHYHTWSKDKPCGYGKWVEQMHIPHEEEHDTSWCKIMD